MTKHYIFFTRNVLPQPQAHLVQTVHTANAAANLGYSAVLVYLQKGLTALNPINLIAPFRPQKPAEKLAKFYNIQNKLKVAPLPTPWPIDIWQSKFTNSSTLVSKYYFPIHIIPHTKIVHSRDWNFIKAAIKQGVPAIYEHHHHEQKRFDPEIVNSPLFQISVTVTDTIRESMIQNGMPPERVIRLHNGFNEKFLIRQTKKASEWREKLLKEKEYLVVYSGGLNKFKGVDLLIDVAKQMPEVQFVLAGGEDIKVKEYQQIAKEKEVENINFLGHLLQDELVSLLQAANVLAHPHCAGKEASFTSPLKLFDYMASGTPIVATDISALNEFKHSNAIAGWCEPDHPTKFAESLKQVLLNYPKKVEGYSDSRNFVEQFSCENRLKKILSFVEPSLLPNLISTN